MIVHARVAIYKNIPPVNTCLTQASNPCCNISDISCLNLLTSKRIDSSAHDIFFVTVPTWNIFRLWSCPYTHKKVDLGEPLRDSNSISAVRSVAAVLRDASFPQWKEEEAL